MTRQQLVEALRVLHTEAKILKLKQRARCLEVQFQNTNGQNGLLIIPTPLNATIKRLQTESK